MNTSNTESALTFSLEFSDNKEKSNKRLYQFIQSVEVDVLDSFSQIAII